MLCVVDAVAQDADEPPDELLGALGVCREELPEGFEAAAFDYVKLGGWVEALGPLTAPTTNQRLYRIGPDGTMEDITKLFRRKP